MIQPCTIDKTLNFEQKHTRNGNLKNLSSEGFYDVTV